MKKKLLSSLVAFFALSIVACSSATNNNEESTSAKHEHTFNVEVWEKNETQHWHPATCEHTTIKGDAAAHTFEEVAGAGQEATCSTPGYKIMKCTVCQYEKRIELTAEHDFQAVTPAHEQGTGEVAETIEKCSRDNTYRITWDAQDANKEKSSGFSSSGKFNAKQDYVKYTFYSPFAIKARLYVKIANRSGSNDSPYDRSSKSGNQSIWYDYYNGPDWKYGVKVNDVEIDQNAQTDFTVGDETVPMKELMYQDFLAEGADQLVAPWFEFDVSEGQNTLRIERTQGYSVSVKEFYVIGAPVAA